MAQVKVQNVDSGEICGKIEIPDDVVAAAKKVRAWLEERNCPTLSLYGLKLEDDD